ncbi:MAG TPA: hypothetical protein VJ066_04325 [Candidatus Bathyarchaeia archaeon]|nr:hypothetical protein [Candidatus Bathyarchaeia archaeon]
MKTLVTRLINYLRVRQLYVGMALATLGGSWQIINATKWEWWVPQGLIDFTNLTPQQRFVFDFGFLAFPLFVISLLMLVDGIILWFTDKNE